MTLRSMVVQVLSRALVLRVAGTAAAAVAVLSGAAPAQEREWTERIRATEAELEARRFREKRLFHLRFRHLLGLPVELETRDVVFEGDPRRERESVYREIADKHERIAELRAQLAGAGVEVVGDARAPALVPAAPGGGGEAAVRDVTSGGEPSGRHGDGADAGQASDPSAARTPRGLDGSRRGPGGIGLRLGEEGQWITIPPVNPDALRFAHSTIKAADAALQRALDVAGGNPERARAEEQYAQRTLEAAHKALEEAEVVPGREAERAFFKALVLERLHEIDPATHGLQAVLDAYDRVLELDVVRKADGTEERGVWFEQASAARRFLFRREDLLAPGVDAPTMPWEAETRTREDG